MQDVPTNFWRLTRERYFDGHTHTLRGPFATSAVSTSVLRTPKQIVSSFAGGWSTFCEMNQFKKGDTLLFSEVKTRVFEVTVL